MSVMAEHFMEAHHRDLHSGGLRAAVFGISDGLVTNVALIVGVAGAHPGAGVVRLTGIAGLVAGAFSMAAGEYISMQAQRELLQRELAVEAEALAKTPAGERKELAAIYESRGLSKEIAATLVEQLMANPELALETHAREELGIDPSALGSPVVAALSSFATFALGALAPLIPWFITQGGAATIASVLVGAASAFGIGVALGRLSGRSIFKSGLRQLIVAGLATGVTYGIGRGVGLSGA